ncbi:MAG TPA: amino acid permease [Terriglobales bacterium]|nr:amino acid permease [Terriglobales bacterium]
MTDAARTAAQDSTEQPSLIRGLSLLDSVLLLVGGIIGSAIFLAVSDVAEHLAHPLLFLGVWVAGGAISLLACFAFAELGAMFPNSGGQYVYLREAYGNLYGFLFGWMVLFINFSGTTAALSVGFATYLDQVVPYGAKLALFQLGGWGPTRGQLVALLAIAFVTWVNVVGLRRAAVFQNIATWAKFAAIAVFVALGLIFGRGSAAHFTTPAPVSEPMPLVSAILLALTGVFWAYDGWNYITCAAGEVKDPQRNIPRALVLGVIAVGTIYVALNVVYLYALPLAQIKQERTIAQAAAVTLFSPGAGRWMSLLIATSCFGAASACTLAGARVVYAMACDKAFFPQLSYVHPRYRTPSRSLVVLGAWSGVLALSGRYDELYTYVMFMGVIAYVGTVAALFVLRRTRPDVPRPYRCTGYPGLPAIYLVIGSIWAAIVAYTNRKEALVGVFIMLIGVPGYLYWKRSARKPEQR